MTAHLQDRKITIGGRSLTFRTSLKFFLSLKERWRCETDEEVRKLIEPKSKQMDGMVDLVWAALQTHHADLSHDDVLTLLDGADLDAAALALGEAMEAGAPPPAPPPGGQGSQPTP